MQLNNLKKNRSNKKGQRVGRGGKRGKTSGKGTKGQNARSGRKKRPEMRDLIKRIPKLRGRGKNFLKSIQSIPVAVKLAMVDAKFSKGEKVTAASLLERGLIESKNGMLPKVKILGNDKISKNLSFEGVAMSESAKVSVIEAGGEII